MPLDAAESMKRGKVSAAPIVAAIERWAVQEGRVDSRDGYNPDDNRDHTARILSERTGIHRDFISNLRSGRQKWIDFDIADRLVLIVEEEYGWFHPDLRDLYETFDFRWIDIQKPTQTYTEIDRLFDEGVPGPEIARRLGVSKNTVYGARERSEAACAA